MTVRREKKCKCPDGRKSGPVAKKCKCSDGQEFDPKTKQCNELTARTANAEEGLRLCSVAMYPSVRE